MREKYSGDGTYYLAARQVEPYRLWFEFLKLAHKDEDISVDYEHYADWGDFYNQSFTDWWAGKRWRTLFGVDVGVRLIDKNEEIQEDSSAITVRMSLSRDIDQTLRDVRQLLEQHNAGVKLETVRQGKFAFTDGYDKAFLKYLDRVRVMLRLYGYWLHNQKYEGKGRLAKTAVDFYQWAKTRDDLIKERKYKYERPLIPFAVGEYARSLIAAEGDTRYKAQHHGVSDISSDYERQFKRYLSKARKLAANAAAGRFPDKY